MEEQHITTDAKIIT